MAARPIRQDDCQPAGGSGSLAVLPMAEGAGRSIGAASMELLRPSL